MLSNLESTNNTNNKSTNNINKSKDTIEAFVDNDCSPSSPTVSMTKSNKNKSRCC